MMTNYKKGKTVEHSYVKPSFSIDDQALYRSPNQQKMLDQLNFALEALEQFEKIVDEIAVDPLIKRVNDGVYDAQESVSTAIVALQTARDTIEEL